MSRLRKLGAAVAGNDLLAGITACVVVAAMIAGAAWFYLSPPGRQTVSFTTRDAAAIKGGDDVRVAGVSVGKVASVDLRDNDVRVSLDVDSDIRIGDRTSVRVELLTAVGGYFVTMTPGGAVTTGSHEISPERVTVPYTIADILQELPRVTDDVDGRPVDESLRQVADGLADNVSSLRTTMRGLQTMAAIVDKQKSQVESVLRMASSYTVTFNDSKVFIFDLVRRANILLSQFHTYRVGFVRAYAELGSVLERLALVARFYFTHRDEIFPVIDQMRDKAGEMTTVIDKLVSQLGPARDGLLTLLGGTSPDRSTQWIIDATSMCLPVPGQRC
ncbi:MCE family protein [Gordonia pseudamarae]|uniref:MCE family protein n=1 Tax=Gordonia pseudamarae TaxID=2831662 RepID=A0ABX6IJB5_9ACTN|nr:MULTISPECIES: MlaD family protein [Gordonia]MBD0023184.1 MCE family protein [Gordonia sp. (in: high G+C Gram-positive bacteria)]QHN27104.1 MCE family protein [Gordonia pseudamarae]QHN35993.1 MCE family protein [Gordonia pseudamarae]